MTRPPPSENREHRRAAIVAAGLRLLEQRGLERLSIRRVAESLEMHPAGLYWYIKNKQELIDLLAKAICDEAFAARAAPDPGESWEGWLTDQSLRLRAAMLAHRDGARVVAGAYLFRTHAITTPLETTLAVMEEAGFTREIAMLGAITAMRYTMGIALDEQASPPLPPEELRRDAQGAVLGGPPIDPVRWPRVADVMGRWFREMFGKVPNPAEHHFRRGLEIVIAGVRSTADAKRKKR